LGLLNARTAADTLVYGHALKAECTESETSRICSSAFARQLVRLGDISGSSAASAQSLARRIGEAEWRLADMADVLRRRNEELGWRDQELSRRETELSRYRDELKAQKETARRLRDDLASHRAWLEEIKGSVSWRITGPLRGAKRRLGRSPQPS